MTGARPAILLPHDPRPPIDPKLAARALSLAGPPARGSDEISQAIRRTQAANGAMAALVENGEPDPG